MKVMILPGNGGCHPKKDHWYPWLTQKLQALGFEVIAEAMPDEILARKRIWVPFIESKIPNDEPAILIGHSSGAVAALRYLETHSLVGAILVGACHSDLGLESERLSGYYSDPWKWEVISKNAEWICLFASQDDPFIPIQEPRFIHQQLNCEYHEYTDRGHFMGENPGGRAFQEIVDRLVQVKKSNASSTS